MSIQLILDVNKTSINQLLVSKVTIRISGKRSLSTKKTKDRPCNSADYKLMWVVLKVQELISAQTIYISVFSILDKSDCLLNLKLQELTGQVGLFFSNGGVKQIPKCIVA